MNQKQICDDRMYKTFLRNLAMRKKKEREGRKEGKEVGKEGDSDK